MAFMSRIVKPLFWGSAGAAVAYLWDPERGRARRIRLKDQANARLRDVRRDVESKVSYARTTAEGKLEQVRKSENAAPPDDATLADKVRSEVLGEAQFEREDVVVDATDGVVTLRGELSDPTLAPALEAAVRRVPGVQKVQSFLHQPETPAPNKEDALRASSDARRASA